MFSKKSEQRYSNTKSVKKLICEIILLDPSEPNLKIQINSTEFGNVLFSKVCDKLGEIVERDYFGLKYIDKHGQEKWLELNKSIHKQIHEKSHKKQLQLFSFRFKHYPKNPNEDLKQDLTRYLLYLQLRRDLFRGKLVGPQNDECRLAALVIQAEIGHEVADGELLNLATLQILPSINRMTEKKILSIYDTFKDLDCQEAEKLFLFEASKFEMYGISPVAVKDQKNTDIFIGFASEGISTYNSGKRIHTFPWNNIMKISFSGKLFLFQVFIDEKKHMLGFKCESPHTACTLWQSALDRKYFFTLDRASDAKRTKSGGTFFQRKKSYTFSGRPQKELSKNCQTLTPQSHVKRSHSFLTVIRNNKSKCEVENTDQKLNGFTAHDTLTRSHGEQVFLCDSKDDDDLSKKTATDKKVRTKPTSAAVGAVLDFMQALRESPLLPIPQNQDSFTQSETQYPDNYSEHSDMSNTDNEMDFLSHMVCIADTERESFILNDTNNNELEDAFDSNRSDFSTASISIMLFGLSIALAVIRIIYVIINKLTSNQLHDVDGITSKNSIQDYIKDFFFK